MLEKLRVKDFALIEDLEIDFLPNLTALTGETGAGKSIILESLHLLFGKRSDLQMIRHGKQKAEVFGVFNLTSEVTSIYDLPKKIEVKREIGVEGKNTIKINDQQVTLQKLKELMQHIGAMHSQSDMLQLLDKSSYITLLDEMDTSIQKPLNQYLLARSHFLDSKKKLEEAIKEKKKTEEQQSFLEYQVKELSELHLTIDELDLVNEKINKMKNFDRIMQYLKDTYQALEDNATLSSIYQASKNLEKLASVDIKYQEDSEKLLNSYYEIDEIKSNVYEQIDQLDFDQNEFDLLQERSNELTKIEQKYHKSINELIWYLEETKEKLLMSTDYEAYLETLKKQKEKAFKEAFEQGVVLSKHRQKIAKKLEKEVLEVLYDLDLEHSQFDIVFETIEEDEDALFEHGIDQFDFYISLNEGEPIKPLSKVASGGEKARFMFALKMIYAQKQKLSMLVLDEIDTGISGRVASKMAYSMKKLAKSLQIIVITHLPQVAAQASQHYGIYKIKENDRTVTKINTLEGQERILMIASMLSGEKLSHYAIEQAKVLLEK